MSFPVVLELLNSAPAAVVKRLGDLMYKKTLVRIPTSKGEG